MNFFSHIAKTVIEYNTYIDTVCDPTKRKTKSAGREREKIKKNSHTQNYS